MFLFNTCLFSKYFTAMHLGLRITFVLIFYFTMVLKHVKQTLTCKTREKGVFSDQAI